MSNQTEQLRSFAGIVGEPNTSAAPQARETYAIDGRAPEIVVRPSNAEEIGEVLRYCAQEKLAVVPSAGATKLRIGAAPARYDVALVTTRLDKTLGYDPGDLTVSVEAGARLKDVTALLAEHRQFLPLAAPYLGQATIGGTVASGVDSPLRQRYGGVRDFLLGIEFVTGDGVRAKSGGRVVKNVAGYDLHKLFIGSLGTLGILTRLNFKTFPLSEANCGFLATFTKESGTLELVRQIRRSPLRASTVEVLNPALASLFAQRTPPTAPDVPPPGPWLSTSTWTVAVSFGGSDAVLKRYGTELGTMAGAAGALDTTLLADNVRPALWDRIREAIPLLLDSSPAATIARVSVLPSRLGDIFAAAQHCEDRYGLPIAILARAAGVVYIGFLPSQTGEEIEEIHDRILRAAGDIAEAAAEAQGFCSIPWCPAELKSRIPIWGKERADMPLMRKLKQAFDPENTLGPGRFIGGL